jgi:hypothetical protein
MTRFAFMLLVAGLAALPLHATNFILNSDFTDGVGHWYGDGRTPEDFARDNNLQTPDAFYSKGVILPLKDVAWTKFAQDFQGNIEGGTITIAYKLSPNCTFSDKPEYYENVPHQINYDGWKKFGINPGKWMLFIADFGSAHGTYWPLKAKTGSDVQAMRFKITGLTAHEDKTITLAFPPGTGSVVLLHISVDTAGDAAPPPPDPDAIPKL